MNGFEQIGNDIARMANRHSRMRDTVYLDTNAWSALIKGEVAIEPLREWIKQNKCYLWCSRFSLGELSDDTRLARPMADLLEDLPIVFLDYGQNEFAGVPWYSVKPEFDNYYRMGKQEIEVVMDELLNGPIRPSRKQVIENGKKFQVSLEAALSNLPADRPRNWNKFPDLLINWLREKCVEQGFPVVEAALQSRECYIGQRLSYAVLYWRYVIIGQKWKPSDFTDYLHSMDMAYAQVVVTEQNLAECFRQVSRKTNVMTPQIIATLDFLKRPSEWLYENNQ